MAPRSSGLSLIPTAVDVLGRAGRRSLAGCQRTAAPLGGGGRSVGIWRGGSRRGAGSAGDVSSSRDGFLIGVSSGGRLDAVGGRRWLGLRTFSPRLGGLGRGWQRRPCPRFGWPFAGMGRRWPGDSARVWPDAAVGYRRWTAPARRVRCDGIGMGQAAGRARGLAARGCGDGGGPSCAAAAGWGLAPGRDALQRLVVGSYPAVAGCCSSRELVPPVQEASAACPEEPVPPVPRASAACPESQCRPSRNRGVWLRNGH